MTGEGRVQVLLFLGGSGGLMPTETTFAKRLQQQGYTTGLIGETVYFDAVAAYLLAHLQPAFKAWYCLCLSSAR